MHYFLRRMLTDTTPPLYPTPQTISSLARPNVVVPYWHNPAIQKICKYGIIFGAIFGTSSLAPRKVQQIVQFLANISVLIFLHSDEKYSKN